MSADATLLLLVALGALIVGAGGATLIGRHYLHVGFQLGRDDRRLDHGETVGSLEAVAEATEVLPAPPTPFVVRPVGDGSGPRHALPPGWPVSDPEATQEVAAVRPEVTA